MSRECTSRNIIAPIGRYPAAGSKLIGSWRSLSDSNSLPRRTVYLHATYIGALMSAKAVIGHLCRCTPRVTCRAWALQLEVSDSFALIIWLFYWQFGVCTFAIITFYDFWSSWNCALTNNSRVIDLSEHYASCSSAFGDNSEEIAGFSVVSCCVEKWFVTFWSFSVVLFWYGLGYFLWSLM